MTLTLFVQSGCDACDKLVAFIRKQEIDCEVKYIEQHDPPVRKNFGIVLPALFEGDQLLAYGPEDIMAILNVAVG